MTSLRHTGICFLLIWACLLLAPIKAQYILNWDFEDIATDARYSGANPDMIIEPGNGTIHISYWNRVEDKLVYTWKAQGSSSWSRETVDPSGPNGFVSSIALDQNGDIAIAYFYSDQGKNLVKFASRTGPGQWAIDTLPDITSHQNGYGKYGVFDPETVVLKVKHSISLAFTPGNDPKIMAFNAYVDISKLATCGGFYSTYDLRPTIFTKNSGFWSGFVFSDYVDKFWACTSNGTPTPLPHGERYGEFCHLFVDNSGNTKAFSNAYYNSEIIMMESMGNDSVWNISTVDSSISIYPILGDTANWLWLQLYYTLEGLDVSQDQAGNFHLSFTASIAYGFSFGSFTDQFQTLVYVRLDTAGNITSHNFFPTTGPPKNYLAWTSNITMGTDSVVLVYADQSLSNLVVTVSGDSGQTWVNDTIFTGSITARSPVGVYGDSIYVLFYDALDDRLTMAITDKGFGGWQYRTVTESNLKGETLDSRIEIDGNDTLIQLITTDEYQNELLLYEGIQNGSLSWSQSSLDQGFDDFRSVNVGKASTGQAVLAYSAGSNLDLRLAIDTGSAWSYENIDTLNGITFSDLKITSGDTLQIAYYDDIRGHLGLAKRHLSGASWGLEVVDSTSGMAGEHPVLGFDPNGKPHLIYFDPNDNFLLHAQRNSGGWVKDTVMRDSSLVLGQFTDLAFNASGEPAVAFGEIVNEEMRFAERNSSGQWVISKIDSSGGGIQVGYPSKLRFDKFGQPWILYNYESNLPGMRLIMRDPNGWNRLTINTTGRISRSFDFHILDEDLYIIGQKNAIGNSGLAMMHTSKALKVDQLPQLDPENRLGLMVYPNPVTGNARISIKAQPGSPVSLNIYSIHGKLISQPLQNKPVLSEISEVDFKGSDYQNGIYFVELLQKDQKATFKMILMK